MIKTAKAVEILFSFVWFGGILSVPFMVKPLSPWADHILIAGLLIYAVWSMLRYAKTEFEDIPTVVVICTQTSLWVLLLAVVFPLRYYLMVALAVLTVIFLVLIAGVAVMFGLGGDRESLIGAIVLVLTLVIVTVAIEQILGFNYFALPWQ